MITIRPVRWPEDEALLSRLDTEFETDRIYRPVREGFTFQLIEETLPVPFHKRYEMCPEDPEERANWEYATVAEEEGRLAGFAAAHYTDWNRRVILWGLYVMPAYRRCGVGAKLLAEVEAYAQTRQARCLWLETQNVNYPAIQFYRRMGFVFCGFDDSLYDPEVVSPKEVALFFSRPIKALKVP